MPATNYPRGTVLELTAQFRDSDGDLVQPDVVKLIERNPTGRVEHDENDGVAALTLDDAEAEQVGLSAGPAYRYELALPQSGHWSYGWVSTGNGAAALEEHLTVLDSNVLP